MLVWRSLCLTEPPFQSRSRAGRMVDYEQLATSAGFDSDDSDGALTLELVYKEDLHGKERSNQLKQAFFWPH